MSPLMTASWRRIDDHDSRNPAGQAGLNADAPPPRSDTWSLASTGGPSSGFGSDVGLYSMMSTWNPLSTSCSTLSSSGVPQSWSSDSWVSSGNSLSAWSTATSSPLPWTTMTGLSSFQGSSSSCDPQPHTDPNTWSSSSSSLPAWTTDPVSLSTSLSSIQSYSLPFASSNSLDSSSYNFVVQSTDLIISQPVPTEGSSSSTPVSSYTSFYDVASTSVPVASFQQTDASIPLTTSCSSLSSVGSLSSSTSVTVPSLQQSGAFIPLTTSSSSSSSLSSVGSSSSSTFVTSSSSVSAYGSMGSSAAGAGTISGAAAVHGNSTNKAAIIGGSVGGAVFLILLLALCLCCRRKRSRAKQDAEVALAANGAGGPPPVHSCCGPHLAQANNRNGHTHGQGTTVLQTRQFAHIKNSSEDNTRTSSPSTSQEDDAASLTDSERAQARSLPRRKLDRRPSPLKTKYLVTPVINGPRDNRWRNALAERRLETIAAPETPMNSKRFSVIEIDHSATIRNNQRS